MATSGPNITTDGGTTSEVGSQIWLFASRIEADDGSSANVALSGQTSWYLKGTDFGFAIPTTATVNGILVEWEKATTSDRLSDNSIRIIKAGTVTGDNKAAGGTWVSGYQSYGGASDLWGVTWTPAEINATDFGAALSVTGSAGDSSVTANVDTLRITITYTAAGGAVATQTSGPGGGVSFSGGGGFVFRSLLMKPLFSFPRFRMKLFLASLLALTGIGLVSATGPQPTCTLTATPSVIWPGQAVTLTWTTTNAQRIAWWAGTALNGSITVNPTTPQLYKLDAFGGPGLVNEQGQYAFCKATVSVRSTTAP